MGGGHRERQGDKERQKGSNSRRAVDFIVNAAPQRAAAARTRAYRLRDSRRTDARAGRACVGTACAVVPSAPCLPLRARVRASALASRSACGCVGRAGPALAGPAWPAHREGWEKRKREAREERSRERV